MGPTAVQQGVAEKIDHTLNPAAGQATQTFGKKSRRKQYQCDNQFNAQSRAAKYGQEMKAQHESEQNQYHGRGAQYGLIFALFWFFT